MNLFGQEIKIESKNDNDIKVRYSDKFNSGELEKQKNYEIKMDSREN